MLTEECASCGLSVVAGHSLSLDGSRRLWRLCCLCTAAIIEKLGKDQKLVGGVE